MRCCKIEITKLKNWSVRLMIKIRVAGFFLMLIGQIYLAKLGVNMIDRFMVLISFGIGTLMVTEGMK